MEAPFRFPIIDLADVQRLLDVLAVSPLLVPSSLVLAEGHEILLDQLTSEGRLEGLRLLVETGDFKNLFGALWLQPLAAQRPRFLRFNAKLGQDPSIEFSMRIDVPADGAWPRWVDLEGSRDPAVLTCLRAVYASLGNEAQLTLLEI